MATFTCETKTFWKGRLYRPGEKINYPAEHADKVPHHLTRTDLNTDPESPEPELISSVGAPRRSPAPRRSVSKEPESYDAREVAAIAGMQASKRNKLLSKLAVNVPGNASPDEVAMLILDAAKAAGVDPLPKDAREKINADPVQPQLENDETPASAPPRQADPDQGGGVAIGDTL